MNAGIGNGSLGPQRRSGGLAAHKKTAASIRKEMQPVDLS